ncbi:MAG: sulfatase-like hydrolase/transferase [Planctomycetota bacterium]
MRVCQFAIFLVLILTGLNVTAEAPRNIIFILADDLGYGDIGVLHQNQRETEHRLHTPSLDAMAAGGAILRHHYCPAPVCAPSRASLLTGVHQGLATIRDNQFDRALERNHTLATVLSGAGYATGLVGKYGLQGDGNNPDEWQAYPTKRGFNEFFGYVRHRDGHQHYPAHHWPLGNSEAHKTPKELWDNEQEISANLEGCYTTDLFTAKAKEFIKANNADEKPFFLLLTYDTPHAALQLPPCEYPEGGGLEGGVQWLGKPGSMINTAATPIDSFVHEDYRSDAFSDVQARFATSVRRVDQAVGDLLQLLKDLQIDDNTIVVFSSDNGPHVESYIENVNWEADQFESYGNLTGIKRDTWEGGIRVPTFAWAPGLIPEGIDDEMPSQFHDWMATFADIASVPKPARCEGVSLVPRWTGEGTPEASTIYVEYQQNGKTPSYQAFGDRADTRRRQMQVIHMSGFKGVRYDIQTNNDPFMVYDLDDDSEKTNLSESPTLPTGLQAAMRKRISRLRLPNSRAPRPYDDVAVASLSSEELTSSPSNELAFHEGKYNYVPHVDDLREASVSVNAEIGEVPDSIIHVEQPGVLVWHDQIDVKETGWYQVSMRGTSPASARIHQIMLLDGDLQTQPNAVGAVKLEAGKHPIAISMLYQPGRTPAVAWDISPTSKPDWIGKKQKKKQR